MQSFKVYFVKDTKDYTSPSRMAVGAADLLQMPQSDMRSDQDIMRERIERDLVAFGEFTAKDLMEHSVNPDDFTSLDATPV